MKIAVSGKGGVGKSTVAAALALLSAGRGRRVLALDADPDANLAAALGVSREARLVLHTISEQTGLIEERTGAATGTYGKVFKLNPDVSDVAERFAYDQNGVSLVVLGSVKNGGGGCACPENTFIRSLVTNLVLYRNETLIMDMEAGIEHLGRATAQGVDVMVAVVEPGQRSIDCAETVFRMAAEIGLRKIVVVGNKATGAADEEFIRHSLPGREILAILPFSEGLRNADRDGVSVLDAMDGPLLRTYGEPLLKIEALAK
jgi:CO dehydrogenase maturation factor